MDLYLTAPADVADATDLLSAYGVFASSEAAKRADRSRDLGNHIHFCRWRQIERLVILLSVECAVGTVH